MVRLGQRLREERTLKNMTIEEVAKATKIRPQFISAIEQGNYKKLPSKAYAHGFVKNYIAFLDLPMRDSLAMFRREFNDKEYIDILPESFTKQRNIRLTKINWPKTAGIIAVVIIGLGLFLLFQYRAAFFNPSLSISSPKENSVLNTGNITIKGSTDVNATVQVDNNSAYVDSNGNFYKDIVLFSGKDTITILATNKFGKSTTIQRHITVK